MFIVYLYVYAKYSLIHAFVFWSAYLFDHLPLLFEILIKKIVFTFKNSSV